MTTIAIDPFHAPYDSGTITLAAGVATVLVFDRRQARGPFGLTINNLGVTNAIDTTVVSTARVSDTSAEYVTQTAVGTAIGSIAHGANATADLFDDPSRFVKLSLTSAGGTTASVQATSGT